MPSDGLGIDVGTTGGSWLFKQGDLLLGPVPFTKLVELLYAGEVDESTPVAPFNLEPKFTPMAQVERFRVHLAKSKAKLRVDVASQTMNRERRRGRALKLASMGLLSIVLLIGGGRLAWWLAIHRPWEKQIQLPEAVITDELPSIKLASARSGEVEFPYPDAKNPTPGANPANPIKARPKPRPGAADPKTPAGTGPASAMQAKPADGDDVAVVQQWDKEAINGVVRSNKATLHPCLMEEMKRQKGGFKARVPLEVVIGNDGRISKLWIDHPDFKSAETELHRCMLAELRKWKFPSYQGEQASVAWAYSIGSK
ncbi:MAG: AgmX/PglI C-terminal domain-containing protein [Deltaproteobacteria bacterium]|nr:AgmX/PglI C-terminal domain-containing protein [Deltaproteobacteria bacterium]